MIKLINDPTAGFEKQRATIKRLADAIAAGEPLTPDQAAFIARILHGHADRMKPKLPPGQAATFDAFGAALRYAHGGITYAELAEKFGISEQAMKKALAKDGLLANVRALIGKSSTK